MAKTKPSSHNLVPWSVVVIVGVLLAGFVMKTLQEEPVDVLGLTSDKGTNSRQEGRTSFFSFLDFWKQFVEKWRGSSSPTGSPSAGRGFGSSLRSTPNGGDSSNRSDSMSVSRDTSVNAMLDEANSIDSDDGSGDIDSLLQEASGL